MPPAVPGFHPLALSVWLAATLCPTILTRNPTYLLCCLVLVVVTQRGLTHGSPAASAWQSFVRLSLIFLGFTLVFNIILGGVGETALLELPAWRWKNAAGEVLFQIGGPVTLESLVFGTTTVLALATVVLALATFNILVDHYLLLRSLPSFLYQAATVVSVGLVFMPQLMQAQKEIRQAHALRGHRIRGFRDVLPLMMTLLAEGLDRAMTLAESMEARGFGACVTATQSRRRRARLGIATGLGFLLAGFAVRGFDRPVWLSGSFLTLGALCVILALVQVGRDARLTRYRVQRWRPQDSRLTASATVLLIVLLGSYVHNSADFHYAILPRVGWPPLNPWLLLPLLLILSPLILRSGPENERPPQLKDQLRDQQERPNHD